MSSGVNINATNEIGQIPLHIVAGGLKDCPDLCKGLLDHSADVNANDENGDTPLHFACKQGRINNIKVLICYGANLSCFNNEGKIPLHYLFKGQ
jgi:ankyrin repeat protein